MNQMISKLMAKLKKKAATEADTYTELKKQRGMSLLEVIIVLGIIGVMAAGVVILAQRAFGAQAVTDIVSNINTVRTSAVQAYSSTGVYPKAESGAGLTTNNIKGNSSKAMAAILVNMGKVSPEEVRNGISGDIFYMGGAPLVAAGTNKGFVLTITGLDQGQCRNILSQVVNQWDYVGVNVAGGAGVEPAVPASLGVAAAATPTAAIATSIVLRSFASSALVAPDTISYVCANTSNNAIVLGSR